MKTRPNPRSAQRRDLPGDLEPFAFESAEAFQLALDAADLADDIAIRQRPARPWVASQIGRSGLSALNNTAEGNGEYSPGDKARFYRYALRSAAETAAMIVFLARKSLITPGEEIRARRVLLKLMKTLGRLAIHFQGEASKRRKR